MSLTLNMVGGGGGSLSATDALLRVQADAGSTVTITKGATTKTDIGHENADDHSVYDYYFIIHQSQFDSVNSWSVTATKGTDTLTKTIIIDAPDEYDLVIIYTVKLLIDGQAQSSLGSLYQYSGTSGTWQITDEYVYLYGSAVDRTIILSGSNGFDITKFSKFRVEAKTNKSDTNSLYTCFGLQASRSTSRNTCFVFKNGINATKQWYEFDISNNTGTAYLFLESVGMPNEMLYVYNIELVA